jgi:hypothetical protein
LRHGPVLILTAAFKIVQRKVAPEQNEVDYGRLFTILQPVLRTGVGMQAALLFSLRTCTVRIV